MNICVYGAASTTISKEHVQKIESLGKTLAKRGHSLVFGGGANGAMGAVARGAKSENANEIVAVVPNFLNVDGVIYTECTKVFYTETMRERKKMLEELSDAFIITPGGLGTFDELFEILSLKQLSRTNKPIVIFNSFGYYDPLIEMLKKAIEGNFMSQKNLELFKATDDINDVFTYIENYDASIKLNLAELKDVKFNIEEETY